jgi:hypothetical protein
MPQEGSQGVLFYLVLLCLWHKLLELLVIPPLVVVPGFYTLCATWSHLSCNCRL